MHAAVEDLLGIAGGLLPHRLVDDLRGSAELPVPAEGGADVLVYPSLLRERVIGPRPAVGGLVRGRRGVGAGLYPIRRLGRGGAPGQQQPGEDRGDISRGVPGIRGLSARRSSAARRLRSALGLPAFAGARQDRALFGRARLVPGGDFGGIAQAAAAAAGRRIEQADADAGRSRRGLAGKPRLEIWDRRWRSHSGSGSNHTHAFSCPVCSPARGGRDPEPALRLEPDQDRPENAPDHGPDPSPRKP